LNTAAETPAGPEHRIEVRVRYPETDRMGVAYHAHYLVWFEMGRTELMRELGCTYGELEEREGVSLPVVRVGADYRASARYDELLDIHTRLVSIGASRVRFEYRLTRRVDDKLLATGFTEHATVGRTGRAVRLPRELRRKLRGAHEGAREAGSGA
jgi:acyl-CoA thioester hydrolase